MRRLIFLFAGCLLAVAAFLLWRHSGSRPGPNILLITLDTTRWDYVSAYGQRENIPPAIDTLAKEGVLYKNAISPSSWTLPSHASIFTGLLPTFHGAHYVKTDAEVDDALFKANKLSPDLPTLAEELKKAGYRTGAIIGGPLLHSRFGVDRGFDYYYDKNLRSYKEAEFYRNAADTTSLATDWLKNHLHVTEGEPFFLFLNYFDAHTPYIPPEPWGMPDAPEELISIHGGRYDDVFKGERELTEEESKVLLSQYAGEIGFMDKQIERLFFEMKRLAVYDSTVIVATSDHGESFGEHRLLGHGRALYEELIRVPLIIKYPLEDVKTGVVERRVSIVSLMPTLLEYIGLRIPDTVASGTLDEEEQILVAESTRDIAWIVAFGERFDKDSKVLYDGNYKWIWNSTGKHELYDISNDPTEEKNLFGTLPDLEERLRSRIEPLIAASQRASTYNPAEIDNEMRENLRKLGYL
jgi:arylsulfatase A-like enzyme